MLTEAAELAKGFAALHALEGEGATVDLLDINASAEVVDVVRVNEVKQILALGHQGEVDVGQAALGRTGSGLEVENHVRKVDELAVTAPAFELGNFVGLQVLGEVVVVETVLVALVTGDKGILVGPECRAVAESSIAAVAEVRVTALLPEMVFKLILILAVEATHVAEIVSGVVLPVHLTGYDRNEVAVTTLAVDVTGRIGIVSLDVVKRPATIVAVVPVIFYEHLLLPRILTTYMMTTAGSTASLAVGTDSSVAAGSGLLLEKKGEVTEELVRLRKCSPPGLDSAVQRRMVSEASTPNLTHRPVRTNPSTFRAKLSSPGCCRCYQAVSSAPPRRKEGPCARANLRDELPDMATRRFR